MVIWRIINVSVNPLVTNERIHAAIMSQMAISTPDSCIMSCMHKTSAPAAKWPAQDTVLCQNFNKQRGSIQQRNQYLSPGDVGRQGNNRKMETINSTKASLATIPLHYSVTNRWGKQKNYRIGFHSICNIHIYLRVHVPKSFVFVIYYDISILAGQMI